MNLRFVAISAITLTIFYIIFTKIEIYSVLNILIDSNPFYLLLALALVGFSILLNAKRWKFLLDSINYEIPYVDCLKIQLAATPPSALSPSKTGDISRAYYLREEIPIGKTVGTILTLRIFDISLLVMLSSVSLLFQRELRLIVVLLFSVFLIFLFRDFIFSFLNSLNSKTGDVFLSITKTGTERITLAKVLISTLVLWSLAIFQAFLFFYAVGVEISPVSLIVNMPIAILIGMIPVTLGGMGTRDAAIIFLFSGQGAPSQLLSVGILFSFFRYWLPALLGVPFMKRLLSRP